MSTIEEYRHPVVKSVTIELIFDRMKAAPTSALTLKPGPNPSNRSNRLEGFMKPTENWLPVVGYEGYYEVSDQGRVRSLDRVLPDGRFWRGRIMRLSGQRYKQVLLRKGDGGVMRRVHSMVLEAFVGPRPPDCEALHGPDGRSDNRLANLRWGTPDDNLADRYEHGEIASGERNAQAKLTPEKVRAIRLAIDLGESQASIARSHGVSKSTVWRAVNTNWRTVR